MDDAVRISAERFRSIYDRGFKTWVQLYADIEEKSGLPALSVAIQDICQQHPVLSRNIRLKNDQTGVFATGESIWSSHGTKCAYLIPPFQQSVRIKVAVKKPISLSISQSTEGQNTELSCFLRNQNYLTVLILAWAYILSARWTEIMPGTCSLTYTECQATTHQDTTQYQDEGNLVSVQLGDVSPQEARWWAAILAPGQGWQANVAYEQQTSLAPWSIRLQQSFGFLLLHTTDSVSSIYSAATFSDATHYLNRFCARHNVSDQSQAALASVLLLPSMGSLRSLRLPTPSSRMGVPHITPGPSENKSNDDYIHKSHRIDKLLTLSCNTRGIRPLLLSVFYEPRIECNAVTPWLQGTLAAIKHVAGNNSYVVGRLCMERSPRVAFLWLGCIILDLQDKLLQEVHFGQIPIDLHSAAWSGTIQSFIQQRVSNPLVTDGSISRADECRLLFLSQSDRRIRIPVCQWKPFGKTRVEDVDIEVRVHQQCEDHWLQYEGINWECEDGNLEFLSSQKADSQSMSGKPSMQETGKACTTVICYEEMARDREAISENATRSIFGWLRPDGYAQDEQDIWKHEWFDMSESDEDDIRDDETTSEASARLSPRVESWVLDTKTSTSASQASRTHSLVSQLQAHQKQVDKKIDAIGSSASLSERDVAQLAQLKETKEYLRQCMGIVADADEAWDERRNVLEDVAMADNNYGISVSTVKDLVVARRINLSGQARYLGGQISDESYQRTIDGLTQLDIESVKTRPVDKAVGKGLLLKGLSTRGLNGSSRT
ncbi:hypothetical protein H9Q69_002699 [Fusarium xylarioides]|nr:hypothetical protein H9Q69_002699 [Fusarium xylarioides]